MFSQLGRCTADMQCTFGQSGAYQVPYKSKTIKGKEFSHSVLQVKLSFPCLVGDIFNEVLAIFFSISFDKYTMPILCQVQAMDKVCVGVQDN